MHKIIHKLTKTKIKSVVERYYCLECETYSIKAVLNRQARYTCTFFPLSDKFFYQFYRSHYDLPLRFFNISNFPWCN
jgi:hypothetical protein